MPVIINDFEVIVEPPANAPSETEVEAVQPADVTPQDFERILAWLSERHLRLLAD